MSTIPSPKLDVHRGLDAFASRLGILATIGFLVIACMGMGTYLQSVVGRLDQSLSELEDQQVRNGYVALSDIQRLIIVSQQAINVGGMTAELAIEFQSATDILFVRKSHFEGIKTTRSALPSKQSSLAILDRIVGTADTAIANNFSDLETLSQNLLTLASQARQSLVQFLDEMRRKSDAINEQQAGIVRQQQVVVLAALAGLTLLGSVALILLRREVLQRRAREKAERRSEFLAYFDSLTGIPNRVQFQDSLKQMLEGGSPLALMFIDLDDFKAINDTNGHGAGDAVLRHIGQILTETAEFHAGFTARLGGDEFAIVVPNADINQLNLLCEQLIEQTGRPFEFEGEILKPSLSIGIATTKMLNGERSDSIDQLSRVTDFALYVSKEDGRKRFTIYDEALEKRFLQRRAMLEELPNAITKGGLEVHFQPKVELENGVTYGFEGLVRWRRDNKLVGPDEFIKLAEESGLVLDIDRYVLGRASQLVSELNHTHGCAFSVSVNLSALHFASNKIVSWVEEALETSGLDPCLLTLEITETVEMLDWTRAQKIISEIKNLGCKIAIDDFGSGYSSLAYLHSTLPDELKIDRSLVEELETSPKARLLLSSVLDIARNLEISVTVEGIETACQTTILQSMGAIHGQGYYFGRPMAHQEAFANAIAANDTFHLKRSG